MDRRHHSGLGSPSPPAPVPLKGTGERRQSSQSPRLTGVKAGTLAGSSGARVLVSLLLPLMSGDLSRVASLLYFDFLMRERGTVIAEAVCLGGSWREKPKSRDGRTSGEGHPSPHDPDVTARTSRRKRLQAGKAPLGGCRGPAVSLRCEEGEPGPYLPELGTERLADHRYTPHYITTSRVTCLNGSLRGGLGVLGPP